MKNIHTSPHRGYRQHHVVRQDEVAFQAVVRETDLHVIARQGLGPETVEAIRGLRADLEAYMALHPEFVSSLVPLACPPEASDIVRRMCQAANVAKVGPMAAVAGTIAQMTAERLVHLSPDILVENGGDVFAFSNKERTIGLLPDPANDMVVGVTVMAHEFPVAFCSSSATIGHSLSFGTGDLVAVRSPNASLADAVATSLANLLHKPKDIHKVVAQARAWEDEGVDGVFVQHGEDIGVWGKMELTMVSI
jgi:ApbE superfamily uncharacterized protein (UPF0280 family)